MAAQLLRRSGLLRIFKTFVQQSFQFWRHNDIGALAPGLMFAQCLKDNLVWPLVPPGLDQFRQILFQVARQHDIHEAKIDAHGVAVNLTLSRLRLNLYSIITDSQSMNVSAAFEENLTGVQPRNLSASEPHKDLEAAIKRSQDYLLSIQHPEGYWVGELMVDSTLVSDMVAYHHWNGKVDPQWQRKAVNHIFSMQLPDGGWNIYYGGPSEVNATIKAYLALKLAGVPVTDPRMLRAREVALNFGGVPRMNTFSKLYLALLGLFPWEYVPTIPCEVLLIGKWFHVNFWDMSNWSRAMLVPLAVINHYKPTRTPHNPVTLDELYPHGFHERDLAVPPDPD